jgi:4-hydroxy-tetrahydrodipicolinate reductase
MRQLQYVIIGKGHLADYLQENLLRNGKAEGLSVDSIVNWDFPQKNNEICKVLIHAGSGRQLSEALLYCQTTGSTLIQASTGINYDAQLPDKLNYILIEAPNLSIPIIKLLYMLKKNGNLFKTYDIRIIESHQARKTSLPATAKAMAESFELPISKIESIRDPIIQKNELHIPEENIDRHARHLIEIKEGKCTLKIESEVLGYDSYIHGTIAITKALYKIEKGKYFITDLVERGIV